MIPPKTISNKQSPPPTPRMPELDIMRLIGIVLVVVGHVTRMHTPMGLIPGVINNDIFCTITDVIYSFHMPMFVFVSGMTLALISQRTSNYLDFWPFIRNKAKRLMIPYFAFAIFWVLPFMVGYDFRDFKPYLINGILLSLDSRHLWYVLMLFNVFIIFGCYHVIVSKTKLPQYSILVISLLVYLLKFLLNAFPYFQISSALEYQFWFVLGYIAFIYNRDFKILIPMAIVSSGIISTAFPMLTPILYALIGIYTVYLIAGVLHNITQYKSIQKIGKNSFGIYLFHPVIIYVLYYYSRYYQTNDYIFALFTIVTSFAISYGLTEIMRNAKLQTLIGEKTKNNA